jgi:3'-phosphoadenosine 5'-phosphosulfate sulfotransferase (PAPS reductase)/FAD synthetase
MTDLKEEIDRAKKILDDAISEHRPVAIFAGFSGGYDSLVASHLAINHESSVRPLHINTGIGIERTREYVRRTCGEMGWKLREEKTSVSYEEMVLGRVKGYPGGFPGPGMHGLMYNRLKERPIRVVMREAKEGHPRSSRVMFVTGIRHDESRVRSGYQRAVSKVDAQVWVNPLYWATIDHFREYRRLHSLPANPVKDRLGMSGECLCGAFASRGDLVRIRASCPETADYILDLERRVRAAGFPWGYEDERPPWWFFEQRRCPGYLFDVGRKPGPLCHSCDKGVR